MLRIKPISISLSPNVEADDKRLAFKLLFQISKWKRGNATEKLENEFKKYFGVNHAFAFNSGRSSLMAICHSLKGLPAGRQGDILLQSFTCNATINPIRWSGFKPVFIDADQSNYNIKIENIEKKITKETVGLMIQHTFGIPAEMDKIIDISKKHNLVLIEDCAHSLGAEYNGKKTGTFGDVSFFSFSRDKIISSVYGGMVITNNDKLARVIKEYRDRLEYPSYFWIKQQLIHPLILSLILPIYGLGGKYILRILQIMGILSKAVHKQEKVGEKPSYFPKRMPNALAVLALNQFRKLERFNKHRENITKIYIDNLTGYEFPKILSNSKPAFLRLPVKHKDAHKIIKKLWKENILIGDWYTSPIAPSDTKVKDLGYSGNYPEAEELAKTTLNLPTHINISEKDAREIISKL